MARCGPSAALAWTSQAPYHSTGDAMTQISLGELADKLAIRELVDAYATCADTRDAEGQMALFTQDTNFVVFMDSRVAEPSYALKGREALAPVFANLRTYL